MLKVPLTQVLQRKAAPQRQGMLQDFFKVLT